MQYLFYTGEGYTQSPDFSNVENLQILGEANGADINEAFERLLKENPWIEKSKFSHAEIHGKQLLTDEIINDIKVLMEYLPEEKNPTYSEKNMSNDQHHLFESLTRLKDYLSIEN